MLTLAMNRDPRFAYDHWDVVNPRGAIQDMPKNIVLAARSSIFPV
jgi:hypothetical protein